MKYIRYLSMFTLIIIGVIAYIPIKDTLFGTPYDFILKPDENNKNTLYFEKEISCNRVYTREIGLLITPPVPIKDSLDSYSAIRGDVTISIRQNDIKVTKFFDLTETGFAISSDGIWSKVLLRYKPITSVFCNKQNISIEIRNISFSLHKHNVDVYISRDRRP